MPVRDGARFLDTAIRSAVEGESEDVELVAVDDGSVDATPQILADWAARDPRIEVLTLDRSHGVAGARNRGLAVARGEFVAAHDADDVFVPARIGAQVAALRADRGAVLACGGVEQIDARGRRLGARPFAEAPEVIAHLLLFGSPIAHPSVMMRREDLLAVGGYDEAFGGSEDYDLWLRLAQRGRIVTVPGVCVHYRLHGGQATATRPRRPHAESLASTRRALSAALGRELGKAETEAAGLVWRETGLPCDLAVADRVFREALAVCPPAARTRVAEITAEHWTGHASRLALAGHPLPALRSLRHAAAWHPSGAAGAAALTLRRIAFMASVRWREL